MKKNSNIVNPNVLNIIKKYLKELKKNGIEITKAVLYGSNARG